MSASGSVSPFLPCSCSMLWPSCDRCLGKAITHHAVQCFGAGSIFSQVQEAPRLCRGDSSSLTFSEVSKSAVAASHMLAAVVLTGPQSRRPPALPGMVTRAVRGPPGVGHWPDRCSIIGPIGTWCTAIEIDRNNRADYDKSRALDIRAKHKFLLARWLRIGVHARPVR